MKKLKTYFCLICVMCLFGSSEMTVKAEDPMESIEETTDQNEVGICGCEELVHNVNYEDWQMLAQLIEAEAGNQDLYGKRLVADVVLNRVDSPMFPNTIRDVIYQPCHFSVIWNGMFNMVAPRVSWESYEAARMEMTHRTDYRVLFFSQEKSIYAQNHYKYQDHWFGY